MGRPAACDATWRSTGSAARDVAALVRGIAGNAPLGSEVVAEIVERTDGVPLFVEELTKAVLEQRPGKPPGGGAVGQPCPGPGGARDAARLAVARLDRIGGAAREIAQIGAVLGRDFSYELIEPVAQRPEPELRAALAQLDDAGLLFCRGVPPQSSYRVQARAGAGRRLRHAAARAPAGTACPRRRGAGAGLCRSCRAPAGIAGAPPDRCRKQRTRRRAMAEGWAARRRAPCHVEAIAHLERGLALLASLPEPRRATRGRSSCGSRFGVSSITVKGHGLSGVAEAYARARELAERHGDDRQLFQATFGSGNNSGAGGIRGASFRAQIAQVADGQTTTDCIFRRITARGRHSGSAASRWRRTRTLKKGAALRCRSGTGRTATSTAATIRASAPASPAAWTEWLLGYPAKARASIQRRGSSRSRSLIRSAANRRSRYCDALVHLHRGEPELALPLLVAADALRAEQRVSSVFDPRFLRGGADSARGAAADAITICATPCAGQPAGTRREPYGLCLLGAGPGTAGPAPERWPR